MKSIATFTVFEKIQFLYTSGDESDACNRRKKVLSKWTYRMKNTWASDEVAPLFVTGPTDSVANPSHFTAHSVDVTWRCCLMAPLNVCGTTKPQNICKDQGLRQETLDFSGDPMPEEEAERQRAKITRTTCAAWSRVSFLWGSHYWWSWCCWPSVAHVSQGVVASRGFATGWELWTLGESHEFAAIDFLNFFFWKKFLRKENQAFRPRFWTNSGKWNENCFFFVPWVRFLTILIFQKVLLLPIKLDLWTLSFS